MQDKMILKRGELNRINRNDLLKLVRETIQLGHDDLVTLVYYLLGHIEGPESDLIRDVLDEVLPAPEKENVMSSISRYWKTEGFNMGILHGTAKGKAEMLLRLLRRRFGAQSPDVEIRVSSATSEQLDEWSDRLIDAHTFNDVFGMDTQH